MKKCVVSLALVFAMLGMFLPGIAQGRQVFAAGNDFVIEDGELVEYRGSGGDVVIPNTVTSIAERVFEDCKQLKSVIIPDSVTNIAYFAFYNCTSLKSVTLPNSLTNLPDWCFDGCSALQSIIIPSSLTVIGECAFNRCRSLKSIAIPKHVYIIGPSAFSGCDSLTKITVDSGNKNYFVKDGILYTKDGKTLVSCPGGRKGKFVVPSTVKEIWVGAFAGCKGLNDITLPNTITRLGDGAFSECTGLKSIKIPDRITAVEDWTFSYCSGLTNAVLPDSVEYLGCCAFLSCTSLKSVTIPKATDRILYRVFENCPKLTDIYYKGTKQQWKNALPEDEDIGLSKKVKIHYNYNPSKTLSITSNPSNASAKANASISFKVKASGSGLKYQWYYKKSGAKSWTKWSKKTSATLSFKMTKAWNKAQVYCLVKDSAGKSVKSKAATATLIQPLKITTQPKNKSVKTGKTATFSLKATGNKLTYQWYYKKKGAKSWTKWSGKTGASVSLKAAKGWNGAQFYCLVKDGSNKSVKSKTVKLSVKAK